MNLGDLKEEIEALIAEQGEDAACAFFLLTAKNVREATAFLTASPDNHADLDGVDPADVLYELQYNAGDPPFDERLDQELLDLLRSWEDEDE